VAEKIFAPGATYRWDELVENVTGQPLAVAALANRVQWNSAS
jgi:hypothetical protein